MRLLFRMLMIKVAFSSWIMPRRLNLDLVQSASMTPREQTPENLLLDLRKHIATTLEFHSFVFRPQGLVIAKLNEELAPRKR